MAEKTLSVNTAMKDLPQLSKDAETEWTRYVITETGVPQSVLISYQEFIGMQETIRLLGRPDVLKQIDEGMSDVAGGKRIEWESSNKSVEIPARMTARFQYFTRHNAQDAELARNTRFLS